MSNTYKKYIEMAEWALAKSDLASLLEGPLTKGDNWSAVEIYEYAETLLQAVDKRFHKEDLYKEYVMEREGVTFVEIPEIGFATYKWLEEGIIYLTDIYVTPSARETGIVYKLADMVIEDAEKRSPVYSLYGSIEPSDPNMKRSEKVLLNYGYKFHHVNPDNGLHIYLKKVKEIKT